MDRQRDATAAVQDRPRRWSRPAALLLAGAGLLAVGPMSNAPTPLGAPAISEPTGHTLPAPPKDGVMGFVVSEFFQPVVREKEACPHGTVPRLRDEYLLGLPAAEQARLRLKENEKEWNRLWQASIFGPNGTNICSQPDMFDRPAQLAVESPRAIGLNLDGDAATGAKDPNGCQHENFVSPTGERGIDNQEYRAMGCTPEWRGADGGVSDMQVGLKQFFASGEWTQVILLKGVNSLANDPDVEVIYGNTADRPEIDGKGNYLRNVSFAISDTAPRHRNVLHGRIVNGILTTDPTDIKLTGTWGQGGARDIRGNRTMWHYVKGRLRLEFQPDGSLRGLLGGYRPIFDVMISGSLGSVGTALVAGMDCAQHLASLKKYADGLRDPKTHQCTGVSAGVQLTAIPAFVNDLPSVRMAAK